MYLVPFSHHQPSELAEAHALLVSHGDNAALYAGGTELLLAMKARVLRYEHLVDLKRISALRGIREENGQLVIGALTTHYQLATDERVIGGVPAYAALSDGIANIRVRVAGTLAGNLCFAEPHADPPSLLAALGASVTLSSPEATRSVPVASFIEGEFTTVRADNEILTDIRIPLTRKDERFCYRRFGHLERPAVGVAAGCVRAGGKTAYRLWIGAIGDRPIHAGPVESALDGVPPNELRDLLPRVAETFAQGLPATGDLHGSADYKRHLAFVIMRRALLEASGQAAATEAING